MKATTYPIVITLNGEAELVIKTAASYQKLLEIAERAEELEALRISIDEIRSGQGIPAEEVFAELRQMVAEANAKTIR